VKLGFAISAATLALLVTALAACVYRAR